MAAAVFSPLLAAGEPPRLLVDGTFEDGGRGWERRAERVGPAGTVKEAGNQFLQIAVPKGRGEDVFAAAQIPPDATAVRVRFRARLHRNGDEARSALMVLIGDFQRGSKGKSIKLPISPEWVWYDAIVRFPAGPANKHLGFTTVASPLAVDIDDITITAAPEGEPAPVPREGPLVEKP